MAIADALLSWYAAHGRSLPWRKTRDPYAILVSEIMLQQTQVERVVPKYGEWLRKFPDFAALANASRADVLRAWSGLGYNNRAVRLHALAKLVVEQHGGKLPETEGELVRLPGIGSYTAGAIIAFAFNRPGRCVDVNIERIIKRVKYPKNKKNITKKSIEEEFLSSFPLGNVTKYANALMDLGSLICTATRPKCGECPVYDDCKSRGERPDEKALRAKKRQPTFLHSNRWWRGQILKLLNTEEAVSRSALQQKILKETGNSDALKFEAALAQLAEEGLVSAGRLVRIRE